MQGHEIDHQKIDEKVKECIGESDLSEADDVFTQAQENMVLFSFEEKNDINLLLIEVEILIEKAEEHYRVINKGGDKFFYCWYDAQSGHLRSSSISKKNNKLPFRCEILETKDRRLIAQEVISESSQISRTGKLCVYVSCI